jgi:hypothetical protein
MLSSINIFFVVLFTNFVHSNRALRPFPRSDIRTVGKSILTPTNQSPFLNVLGLTRTGVELPTVGSRNEWSTDCATGPHVLFTKQGCSSPSRAIPSRTIPLLRVLPRYFVIIYLELDISWIHRRFPSTCQQWWRLRRNTEIKDKDESEDINWGQSCWLSTGMSERSSFWHGIKTREETVLAVTD